jgi:hypothetical protein
MPTQSVNPTFDATGFVLTVALVLLQTSIAVVVVLAIDSIVTTNYDFYVIISNGMLLNLIASQSELIVAHLLLTLLISASSSKRTWSLLYIKFVAAFTFGVFSGLVLYVRSLGGLGGLTILLMP